MCHFLYAVPRLIFLTAPLIYLLLNHTNIPDTGRDPCLRAASLTLSNVTNSRIQANTGTRSGTRSTRRSFALHFAATMMALINRVWQVQRDLKRRIVKRTFFDTRIAQPFLIMLMFNIAACW